MAKQTVATTNARIDEMEHHLATLAAAVTALVKQDTAKPKAKPKAKPWLQECPEYATAAQRVEFEKLAKRANEQRGAVAAAMGCEVSCFIPVPKEQGRMPHSIKWTGTYSK